MGVTKNLEIPECKQGVKCLAVWNFLSVFYFLEITEQLSQGTSGRAEHSVRV